jgi:hypothetical protein
MKNKTILALITALLVAILLLFGLWGGFKKVGKVTAGSTDFTETTVPIVEQIAFQKIQALSYGTAGVNRGIKLRGKFNNFWLFDVQNSNNVGDDHQLLAHSDHNLALRRYLEVRSDLRKNDFYLLPPTDFYWPSSEYVYRGKPAPFACGFIVHLQATGSSMTRVEVIETLPLVKIGRRLGISAHTGPLPWFFDDIRPVAPTTEDRLELLGEFVRVLQGS